MKKTFFTLLLLFFVVNLQAQHVEFVVDLPFEIESKANAKISKDTYLQLTADVRPLADVYIADISSLELKDQAQARRFFERFDDDNVAFYVDWAKQAVYIRLIPQDEGKKDWDVEKWATYFKMKVHSLREKEGQDIDKTK
ncbi:MAG: hypothetical protein JJT94_15305 [Bernardetiaceae bacterium]|nr:hypothetical protein [Bernardetiaceae bacterium]